MILNLYNLQDTMAQFNVVGVPIKAGKKIDLGSPIAPIDDEGRKILQDMADQFHQRFRDVVLENRQRVDRQRSDQFRRPGLHRLPGRRTRTGRLRRLPERRHRRGGPPGRLPARHRHVLPPRATIGPARSMPSRPTFLAKRAGAAEPAGTRPQPAADLPLSVAGRADHGKAGGK